MLRGSLFLCALLTTIPFNEGGGLPMGQTPRSAKELISDMAATDASVRTRAACGLRELGDRAVDAIAPLVAMLADGSPVDGTICNRRWSNHGEENLTSPGEEAAAALVAIGTRAFQPVLAALDAGGVDRATQCRLGARRTR